MRPHIQSSSLRKQGPITTGVSDLTKSSTDEFHNNRHGVWVPAFAGTTSKRFARRANQATDLFGLSRVSSPYRKNISLRRLVETALLIPPSRLTRGAYRDRHGRWVRDAVDVMVPLTNGAKADGEVVWS
jgi:hypothetical protein